MTDTDTDSVTLCPFTTGPADAPLFRLLWASPAARDPQLVNRGLTGTGLVDIT